MSHCSEWLVFSGRMFPLVHDFLFLCHPFLLSTLLGLVYPRLTGYLIDDVIAKGQGDRLPWLVGLLVLVFLGRDGLNALRILLNNLFEQKVILDLRRDLYSAFQRLSISWYEDRKSVV